MKCRRLVPIYDGKTLLLPDEIVEVEGAPDWKHEPCDKAERATWERDVANPARVEGARRGFERREKFIDAEKHDAYVAMHQHKIVHKGKPGTGTSHLSNGGA